MPFVTSTVSGFSVRFVKSQRALLVEAMACLTARQGMVGIGIRTGADSRRIGRLRELLRSADGEETFSVEDLHVLYAVLVAVCNMFASEEAFHIRTGFFREHALALAEGMVKAVEEVESQR